ncbi:hypothetical protein VNO77_30244 [Canavalia gladiata]|uniref:Uncharacterized protein n=1 Tax=Canavalia gladiata TaxID=3824 RepID=A0AAN9KNM5_CANGL
MFHNQAQTITHFGSSFLHSTAPQPALNAGDLDSSSCFFSPVSARAELRTLKIPWCGIFQHHMNKLSHETLNFLTGMLSSSMDKSRSGMKT